MLMRHAICYHINTEAAHETAYILLETDTYIICKENFCLYFDSNLSVFEGP